MKPSSTPIPRHVQDYLDWLDIERGLSSKSQENYARFIKKFIDWLNATKRSELKPHELSPEIIRDYRVFLSRSEHATRSSSLKKNTQNFYLIALRSLLNYFAERDITSLPSEKIKLARDKADRAVRFLTYEQVQKLLSACDLTTPAGLRDRAIFELLFSTGLRISELVALNRDQIPLHGNERDMEIGIIGKGGRARTVYVSARAMMWLKKYLRARSDVDKPLFINYRNYSGDSKRLTPRSIQAIIKNAAKIAGLPLTTTPHVLRHSFATDLLTKGVDIRILQEFLGHKNIAATQIYTHVTNRQLQEIHRKFHGR